MAASIPRRRAAARWLAVLLVATAVALGVVAGPAAAPAGAHASVIEVRPNAGEVLERSPRAVKVWFTEGVDVALGGVFVYDARGERVPVGKLRQPSPDRLVLPIDGRLDDGSYIVTWRAVSEDTHPIQGTWTFQVGSASASAAEVESVASRLLAGQEAGRSVAIGWAVARWTVYAATALLVGGTVFGAVVWPRARDARATRRLVAVGWVGLTAATIVGVALFGAYSRGGSLADAVDPDVVRATLDSRSGAAWLTRLALLAVAFVLLRVLFAHRPAADRPLPAWWLPLAAVTGVGLVATPGFAGHASTGDQRVLALLSDTVHVAAMAVWLGGLVVLAAAVLPTRDLAELRRALLRFSRVSTGCVAALVATGAYQSWRLVGGLDALRNAEFGRILVVKLVVFAVMLVVATSSREIAARLTAPRDGARVAAVPVVRGGAVDVDDRGAGEGDATTDREVAHLRRSVWAEVALGAAVLVVSALLVNAAPPAGGSARLDGATGVTIEDPRVTLDVTAVPGAAGLNDLHVNTYSPAGGPLDVDAVEMTLALPGRGIAPMAVPLRELGPGHYFSPGLDIPLAGVWRLEATVRLSPTVRVDVGGDLEVR